MSATEVTVLQTSRSMTKGQNGLRVSTRNSEVLGKAHLEKREKEEKNALFDLGSTRLNLQKQQYGVGFLRKKKR